MAYDEVMTTERDKDKVRVTVDLFQKIIELWTISQPTATDLLPDEADKLAAMLTEAAKEVRENNDNDA